MKFCKIKYVQIIAVISALTLISGLVSGCAKQTDGMVIEEVTVPVITTRINPVTIKNEVTFTGKIEANESVSVVGKMAGKVESVYFDIGNRVSAGDMLYTLDKKDVENQIAQLTASLNTASVGVNSAQTGLQQASSGGQLQSSIVQLQTAVESTSQNVAAAQQSMEAGQKAMNAAQLSIENALLAIENAQLQLNDIEKSYNDTKVLFDAGVATQAQMDSLELAYNKAAAARAQVEIQHEQAKLQLEQAEIQYNQTEIQYNQALIAQKQAAENYDITTQQTINDNKQLAANSVNNAIAQRDVIAVQLENAKSTLKDLSVVSPIEGVITARNITAGEMASMAVPSFVIQNIDTVKVDVKVSEMIINKLAVGQEVNLSVKTLDDNIIVGKIKTIIPSADATNMYPVKIEIDNTDGSLKPGMFAEVSFVKEMSADTIVVARDTVMQDEKGKFVYINDNGVAKRVPVDTGIDNGREIEIISGIESGYEVITTGQTNVIDGIKINIVTS